jgi:hypothetical protein
MTLAETPPKVPNVHPELEVPEPIITACKLFPEVVERLRNRHYAAEDGRCRDCGQDSPCDLEVWIATLYPLLDDHERRR